MATITLEVTDVSLAINEPNYLRQIDDSGNRITNFLITLGNLSITLPWDTHFSEPPTPNTDPATVQLKATWNGSLSFVTTPEDAQNYPIGSILNVEVSG
jgi:hypothetical protein